MVVAMYATKPTAIIILILMNEYVKNGSWFFVYLNKTGLVMIFLAKLLAKLDPSY